MPMVLRTDGWFDERIQNFAKHLTSGHGIRAYKLCGEYAVEAHPGDATQRAVVESLYSFYNVKDF